jgi:hypothetical protein
MKTETEQPTKPKLKPGVFVYYGYINQRSTRDQVKQDLTQRFQSHLGQFLDKNYNDDQK